MRKLLLSALLIVVAAVGTMAQNQYATCQPEKEWDYILPNPANNTYRYVAKSALSETYEKAHDLALIAVLISTDKRFSAKTPIDVMREVCVYEENLKPDSIIVTVLCQVAESLNVEPVFGEPFNNCEEWKTTNLEKMQEQRKEFDSTVYVDWRRAENNEDNKVIYDREKFEEAYKKYFKDN